MSEFIKHPCGAIPSPPDERDYHFGDLVGGAGYVPEYHDNTPNVIWDQGESSQCGACAGSTYRYEQEFDNLSDYSPFSHTYIYGKDSFVGEGMYGRDVASLLIDGVPKAQSWETWGGKAECRYLYERYKGTLADEVAKYKATSYYFCATWTEVLQAIAACKGVIAMFPLYDNWYTVNKTGVIGGNRGRNYGYHFVYLKDYTKLPNGSYDIRFVNSWGTDWGDNGYGYLNTDMVEFVEAFAIVDDTEEVKKMYYADVDPNRWSAEAINKVSNAGLMTGSDDGLFHPEDPLTREQLATVLARLLDKNII